MCGFRNKGINIRNCVDFSGIYPIQDVAHDLCEENINPPGFRVSNSNWKSSLSFNEFGDVGGLLMSW